MSRSYDIMLNSVGSSGISTNYDTSKSLPLEYTKFGASEINVYASMLEIQLSNISSATKIFSCLSRDLAGDKLLMTETKSDIQNGITTNTLGAVSYRLDVIIRDVQDKTLYLHIRTNSGSCDVLEASLTYEC